MFNGNGDGKTGRGPLAGWHRGVLARISAARTALRIGFRLYPRAFGRDEERVERVLRAFATAVIPGVPEEDPFLTRPFFDTDLSPLPRHREFLAWDLGVRAARRYGRRPFEELAEPERTAVIKDGLEADTKSARLYGGAIFVVQIACYAGIYRDDVGCPLIAYEGRFRERDPAEIGYADAESFLAPSMTVDGNPA